jgi:hypothetical protein
VNFGEQARIDNKTVDNTTLDNQMASPAVTPVVTPSVTREDTREATQSLGRLDFKATLPFNGVFEPGEAEIIANLCKGGASERRIDVEAYIQGVLTGGRGWWHVRSPPLSHARPPFTRAHAHVHGVCMRWGGA